MKTRMILLLLFIVNLAQALVVQTTQDIDLKQQNGELKGRIIFNGKIKPNIEVLGNFKLSKNKKNILFSVTHIKKGENYHTLSNQPTTIKETKGKKKIPRGTKLVLAGELESEIANILGMRKEEYRAGKGKIGAGGNGSNGSSSSKGFGGIGGGYYANNSNSSNGSNGGGNFGNSDNGIGDGSGGGIEDGTNGGGSSGGNGGGGNGNSNGGSNGGGSSGGNGGSSNGGNGGSNGGGGSNPFPPISGGGGNTDNGGSFPPIIPPIGGGGNDNGNGGIIIPPPSGNGSEGNKPSGGAGSDDNKYSSQYCKSPERRGNTIILSVIDRDGKCIELQANRDDTKCQYRYDFNNGVAIKQTQFYYIDRENVTQNIGGCVDLEGTEFQYKLYTDDSKCKLQSTEDKGYGGGASHIFQTQILFRGADGLIHIAKDCSDFANVQEELLSYELDYAKKKLKRIVNQYYIDPTTGQKVYISNGIQSPYEFEWKEYTCGNWEMDDANLRAYRPTQIRAFDAIAGAYYNITGCDYTTDQGKSGKITQNYTKVFIDVDHQGVETGDLNTAPLDGDSEQDRINKEKYTIFEVKEQTYGWTPKTTVVRCKTCGNCIWGLSPAGEHTKHWNSYFLKGEKVLARWKTQYKTTNRGITEKYVRPRQDNDTDEQYKKYQFYFVSKAEKVVERIPVSVEVDEIGISRVENYMKYYEITELSNKLNLSNEVLIQLNTQEYRSWKSKYYRKGKGDKCLNYSISNGVVTHDSKYICEYIPTYNGNINCSTYNDYIFPNPPR